MTGNRLIGCIFIKKHDVLSFEMKKSENFLQENKLFLHFARKCISIIKDILKVILAEPERFP